MASRPLVTVQSLSGDGKQAQVRMPPVFTAPIRPDVVQFVHTNMNKNKRQAYSVYVGAGHQHSAESWGTGRAVSRIPRVSGGGTSRSGQGAFGNMCRKGRMFAPTKTWRKWHRKINQNQRRFAVASAVAASALPALVMARGHRVDNVAEFPLVVDDSFEKIAKTKAATEALSRLGASDDVDKARDSRKLRRGKGKMRNRRRVNRKGPLIIYAEEGAAVAKAVRNLVGVDSCHVSRLNLLTLAPGGHLGRFCIWTKSAFEQMTDIWGSSRSNSSGKKGYVLPQHMMTNADLTRIINSDEIQSKLKAAKSVTKRARLHKNPLKNFGVKVRLNPYALALRRAEHLAQKQGSESKAAAKRAADNKNRAKEHRAKRQKTNYERMAEEGKVWEEASKGSAAGASGGSSGAARPKGNRTEAHSQYQSFDDDAVVGESVPDLSSLEYVTDAKLAPKAGNPTVYLLWAKYHKPGYKFLPLYSELNTKYPDLNVVGVGVDPAAKDLEKFLKDPDGKYSKVFNINFAVAHDVGKKVKNAFEEKLMDTLNVVHAFLVDANGTIVWHQDHSQVGATAPTYMEEVDGQVSQLLAGKPLYSYGPGPKDESEEEDDDDDDEEEYEDSDEE